MKWISEHIDGVLATIILILAAIAVYEIAHAAGMV